MPWVHGRSIDYHERINWAIIWVAISPDDEAFVYREWDPSPREWINLTISEEIVNRNGMQRFIVNLIDPLARKIQTNSGISTIEDLNTIFHRLRVEGLSSGTYWEPFDTKGMKGRDEIKKRLKNSLRVERPFNNHIKEDGRTFILPTLWISKECPETAKSLKQWRHQDWATNRLVHVKDKKESTIKKFSHFCTALEGLFKDIRFKARKDKPYRNEQRDNHGMRYFQDKRR